MKSVPVFGGAVVPGAVQGVVCGEALSAAASIGFLPQRPYVLFLTVCLLCAEQKPYRV
jgi:hypothetical protein